MTPNRPVTPNRPLVLAHRGDHRVVPENTLAAFHAALALPGCDGLEFDVRLSRDGVPVVIHDETLERVQRRPVRVADLAADALEALGVPSLRAVLEIVPVDAFLDVELKEDAAEPVVDALRDSRVGGEGRGVVSSFDADTLVHLGRIAPGRSRWLNAHELGDEAIDLAARLGCAGIAARWGSVSARGVARAREAGLEVAAWTVRRAATFERLAGLGVVAVCVEGEALGLATSGPPDDTRPGAPGGDHPFT